MPEPNRSFERCSRCGDPADVIAETGRKFYSNGYCNRCGAAWAKERRARPENVDRGREVHRDFYYRHREKRLSQENERARKRKLQVIARYGGSCACCGESQHEFLAIDHIYGGGGAHRKEIQQPGSRFYQWLIRNGYPDGFRVLCHNCNSSLGKFGYCPHGNVRVEEPPVSSDGRIYGR